MDKKLKDEIQAALFAQRDEIFRTLEEHGGYAAQADDLGQGDAGEKATALATGQVDQRIIEDDGNLLEKIALALRRIEEGIYETCAGCGNPIPRERLLAKPAVSLCVNCQQKQDDLPAQS